MDFAELDIVVPFLHKTLTSISSAHFLEFSLLLCQGWRDLMPKGGNRRRVWGTGWEMVDEVLYVHAAQRKNFQVTVKTMTGLSTVAAVKEKFPRMKSKGSLFIVQQSPKW